MNLSVQWAGSNFYPGYAGAVHETVAAELIKQTGSVDAAAALKERWNQTGRPARSPWGNAVDSVVVAVSRILSPTVFSRYSGIKIGFIG